MAVELEQDVMRAIGLHSHYNWYNGSGSCAYIRKDAVAKLQSAAAEHGLTIAPAWLRHCHTATEVDDADGQQYTLTNTWVACSYAIQDAIHRKEGGKGFVPDTHQWHFWDEEGRQRWNRAGGDLRPSLRRDDPDFDWWLAQRGK